MNNCKIHPALGVVCFEDGSVMIPRKGLRPPCLTKGCKTGNGYLQVYIKGDRYSVHRLVVEAFIGLIPADKEIDHINRNKTDNRLENLRIVTHSENQRNRSQVDKVTAEGRTHSYEDFKQYIREVSRKRYARKKA